jgi:HTH-type transcriptional regulator/antitoxin HigA
LKTSDVFFGVASLFNLDGVKAYSPAFRQNSRGEISHESLAAWLRAGAVLAEKDDCLNFDKARLLEAIPFLRSLSRETDPNVMIATLKDTLRKCGVALVVIRHFKKTHTTGATFWLRKEKAVLMMSLRGSWADIFWFSLFHELGHILLHARGATFLEDGTNGERSRQEGEADLFAQKTLIPKPEFDLFLSRRDFSYRAVQSFSDEIEVALGVIVGRLQHEKIIPYTNNMGRVRYKWQ